METTKERSEAGSRSWLHVVRKASLCVSSMRSDSRRVVSARRRLRSVTSPLLWNYRKPFKKERTLYLKNLPPDHEAPV